MSASQALLNALPPRTCARAQIGFFDFVCKPLFLHFTARFKGAQPLLTGLLDNYAYWVAKAAEAAGQQGA